MEKIKIEKQGRIIIPKKIREKLNLRSGEEMSLNIIGNEIFLKAFKSPEEFSEELRGCVKESKIKALELKKIWEI